MKGYSNNSNWKIKGNSFRVNREVDLLIYVNVINICYVSLLIMNCYWVKEVCVGGRNKRCT